MISAKLTSYALVFVIALIGGIGLQQRVLSRKEVVKVDYDKVRSIVAEEMKKMPKPEPGQSLDIDKIKGKVGKLEIHQHFHTEMNGDSLVVENFLATVREELKAAKIVKCK